MSDVWAQKGHTWHGDDYHDDDDDDGGDNNDEDDRYKLNNTIRWFR